jgi:hypothetical protein
MYGDRGGIEVVHNLKGSELKVCMGENIESASWQILDAGSAPTNYRRFVDAVRNGVPPERRSATRPSCRKSSTLQSSRTKNGLK